jgi:hypothetical protein
MGVKTLGFSVGLIVVSVFFTIISLVLPFHEVAYVTGYVIPVFSMKTYPLWVSSRPGTHDNAEGIFCVAVRKGTGGRDLCEHVIGTRTVQNAAQQWCAQAVRILYPSLCAGLGYAYPCGLFVTFSGLAQLALLSTAVWLLWRYLRQGPKKQLREVAQFLIVAGCGFHAVTIAIYGILVLSNLDDMLPPAMISSFISPSRATGVDSGYWLTIVALLLQVTAILLLHFFRHREEKYLEEVRRMAKFEAEMAAQSGPRGEPAFEARGAFDTYAEHMGWFGGPEQFAAPSPTPHHAVRANMPPPPRPL